MAAAVLDVNMDVVVDTGVVRGWLNVRGPVRPSRWCSDLTVVSV